MKAWLARWRIRRATRAALRRGIPPMEPDQLTGRFCVDESTPLLVGVLALIRGQREAELQAAMAINAPTEAKLQRLGAGRTLEMLEGEIIERVAEAKSRARGEKREDRE
jgi:hypothetical protein